MHLIIWKLEWILHNNNNKLTERGEIRRSCSIFASTFILPIVGILIAVDDQWAIGCKLRARHFVGVGSISQDLIHVNSLCDYKSPMCVRPNSVPPPFQLFTTSNYCVSTLERHLSPREPIDAAFDRIYTITLQNIYKRLPYSVSLNKNHCVICQERVIV